MERLARLRNEAQVHRKAFGSVIQLPESGAVRADAVEQAASQEVERVLGHSANKAIRGS